MIRRLFTFCLLALLACSGITAFGQDRPFHVLAFYSTNVEQDHVDFAMQAIPFFQAMATRRPTCPGARRGAISTGRPLSNRAASNGGILGFCGFGPGRPRTIRSKTRPRLEADN